MSQLYINTAQNVQIAQIPASIAERVVAHVIDYALFGGYALIFLLFIGSRMDYNIPYMVLASLPIMFYDLVCEISMNGQSAGKKVMRIKVVKEDGSEADMVSYFTRWAFRLVETASSFGAVATLTTIINGKGKRLGDIVAGTRVIRLKKTADELDLFSNIAEDYKPSFPEAINLNDKDIRIIREVLEFCHTHPSTPTSEQMMRKTKSAIEKKLQITSDWYPYNFLERIVKDYTFLSLN
jgi:uncharacterized RDD family membrane protein YckC